MTRLTDIANKYNTDKGTITVNNCYPHKFTEYYQQYFEKYLNKKVYILEIGIDKGYSLSMYNEFFNNNCEIYALDIDDKHEYNDVNIHTFKCDQGDRKQLNNIYKKFKGEKIKFDIIIDDGSHYWEHQLISLSVLKNLLTDDGIYIIEDIHTSLDNNYSVNGYDAQQSALYCLNYNIKPEYLSHKEWDDISNNLNDIETINIKTGHDFNGRSAFSVLTFNNIIKKKILVCCITRNENNYLKEFVKYYKTIGVDNILFYDCNFEGESPVKNVINDDFCIIKDGTEFYLNHMQLHQNCFNDYKDKYEWIAYFNADEFIELGQFKNIKEFLDSDRFDDTDAIHINWRLYGDNGFVKYENKPLNERFIQPSEYAEYCVNNFKGLTNEWPENYYVKSICRTNKYIYWYDALTQHTPSTINENLICRHSNGTQEYVGLTGSTCYDNEIYLKHFQTKTIDEYLNIKMKNISNKDNADIYNLDYFFKINGFNDEKLEYAKSIIGDIDKNVPFFSIIIPCYNCRKTICNTLDTLVKQTGMWQHEVILCDDKSSDDFMEVVEPYKQFLNIRYIRTDDSQKQGPSAARNKGLSIAKGKWIIFIDSDDNINTNVLHNIKDIILLNDYKYFIKSDYNVYNETMDNYNRTLDFINVLHGNIYEKEFLDNFNIRFNEDFKIAEDGLFNGLVTMHLIYNNYIIHKIDPFYNYVYHSDSLTTQISDNNNAINLWIQDNTTALIGETIKIDEYFKYYESNLEFTYKEIEYLLYRYLWLQLFKFYEYDITNLIGLYHDLVEKIIKKCGINKDIIINYIYNDPNIFNKLKTELIETWTCGEFIEIDSFKEFIETV